MRLYTAGIADFEKIRQRNRIYVDKDAEKQRKPL